MVPGRSHEASRFASQTLLVLVASAVVLHAAALPALAVKWHQCPSHVGYFPSTLGAASAPFVHPGHELGIFLSEAEVARSGGFSTESGGNTVRVMFVSLFGDPVILPPFTVPAVTRETLFFQFPDTQALLGRPLAGPVQVDVRTGERMTAVIHSRHLLALPPANNVAALVAGGVEQTARATLDGEGSVWIPVEFSSFGPMEKPMPGCPMQLIPLTTFSVGVDVSAPPVGTVSGFSLPPFRALRRVQLFLGDMFIGGANYYGMELGAVPVLRIPRGFGIKVCGVNDAVDLVLRARGQRRWVKSWSFFAPLMLRSKPLDIVLRDVSAESVTIHSTGLDSFGQECLLH